jgi:hypothetical protein
MVKAKLGKGTNVDLGDVVVEEKAWLPLRKMLGKRYEPYSQGVIEIGLTLMAQHFTAPQAVAMMRAFLLAECPGKKEGVDFRVPPDARFREWRRYLEAISDFLLLSEIAEKLPEPERRSISLYCPYHCWWCWRALPAAMNNFVKLLHFADHHLIRTGDERERLVTASLVMTRNWGPSWGKQLPGERPRETAET